MRDINNAILLVISGSLAIIGANLPVGHPWLMVLHIFVGIMLVLLWERNWLWPFGWICLLMPSIVEAVIYFKQNLETSAPIP